MSALLTYPVLQLESDCEISLYSDLLTYSALCWYSRFGRKPKHINLAWHTGLTRQTISESMGRLSECGYTKDGFASPAPCIAKATSKRKHFSEGYAFWNCLSRNDDSPLTVLDTMVYSFLRHNLQTKYTADYSFAMIASRLKASAKQTKVAIENLIAVDLMREGWQVASEPSEDQQFFKRKEPKEKKQLTGFISDRKPAITKQATIDHQITPTVQSLMDICYRHLRSIGVGKDEAIEFLSCPDQLDGIIIGTPGDEFLDGLWQTHVLRRHQQWQETILAV